MTEDRIKIRPTYEAIAACADICEPWIEAWSGGEWGDSMMALLSATHTDHGLSDEDCATLAEILLRNVITQREWMVESGYQFGCSSPEQDAQAAQQAARVANQWASHDDANSTIAQCPDWMFGGAS